MQCSFMLAGLYTFSPHLINIALHKYILIMKFTNKIKV